MLTNIDKVKNYLEEKGIKFTMHPVSGEDNSIESTVAELGIKYKEGMSTLVYLVRDKEFLIVLRRDDRNINLANLKKIAGSSRVSFAGPEDIKRLGLEEGLASPVLIKLAQQADSDKGSIEAGGSDEGEAKLKIILDNQINEMDKIVCGSGSADFALELRKKDLFKILGESGVDYTVANVSEPNPKRQDYVDKSAMPNVVFAGKIKTDAVTINKFMNWGVDQILPNKEGLEKKLLSGERITAYMGFDPTGPYLHVGHAMGIRALRMLQELGHRVIFLVGDYTARVGDPDKDTTRALLTEEQIQKNMSGWKEQASSIIDFEDKINPVEFKQNFNWLSKLKLDDIIKLMSSMTVQQMLERDLFARRINENNPIQLQEFIYPLMQGYDSIALQVDLEIGGTDQIFNMMVGRDLVKAHLGKEKFVRAQRMMPAPNGITMSKTKGNGINLADSAQDMYGKAMSYSDEHILLGLELLTETTTTEITEISRALEMGENPMQFKKLMAQRIVETHLGKAAAEDGQKHFEDTVQKKEVSESRTKISIVKLVAILQKNNKQGDVTSTVAELQRISKTNAKQLISQGGVEINSNKHTSLETAYNAKIGDIIKIGKRNWYEIIN